VRSNQLSYRPTLLQPSCAFERTSLRRWFAPRAVPRPGVLEPSAPRLEAQAEHEMSPAGVTDQAHAKPRAPEKERKNSARPRGPVRLDLGLMPPIPKDLDIMSP
jgi:hypothetical protein